MTEGTFDAYLYQMIENKQKFISQIMTSKSPARTVEDIDETALQLLKQSFLSQKYDMEDKLAKQYPREIKDLTEKFEDYEADIALVKEHTPSDREIFPVMQIKGITYDEKQEVEKPFPQEEELKEKVARLGELNALLDMDKKDSTLLDAEPDEEIEEKEKSSRVLER